MEAPKGGGAAATPTSVPISIPLTAATARLLTALPAGVLPEALQGPWLLPTADVVFEAGVTGARRHCDVCRHAVRRAGGH